MNIECSIPAFLVAKATTATALAKKLQEAHTILDEFKEDLSIIIDNNLDKINNNYQIEFDKNSIFNLMLEDVNSLQEIIEDLLKIRKAVGNFIHIKFVLCGTLYYTNIYVTKHCIKKLDSFIKNEIAFSDAFKNKVKIFVTS